MNVAVFTMLSSLGISYLKNINLSLNSWKKFFIYLEFYKLQSSEFRRKNLHIFRSWKFWITSAKKVLPLIRNLEIWEYPMLYPLNIAFLTMVSPRANSCWIANAKKVSPLIRNLEIWEYHMLYPLNTAFLTMLSPRVYSLCVGSWVSSNS